MKGNPSKAARQLINYSTKLCAGNNSQSTIQDKLKHLASTSIQEQWRREVLQQAMTMLATHLSWLALPNDTVVVPALSPELVISKVTSQLKGLLEHICYLVNAKVRAYIKRYQA